MIDRVHCHPAHMRPPALPTGPAGLAARNVHMIHVPDLPDRCVAAFVDAPDFAGGQFHEAISPFAVVERRLLTSAPCNLATSPRG